MNLVTDKINKYFINNNYSENRPIWFSKAENYNIYQPKQNFTRNYIENHIPNKFYLRPYFSYSEKFYKPITNFTREYADYTLHKNWIENKNKKWRKPISNLTNYYEKCTREHTDSEYSDSEDEDGVHQNSDE